MSLIPLINQGSAKLHQWARVSALLGLVLFSCNTTKYVPEGQYLLGKNKLKFEKKDFKKEELQNYIRQKPNKRILGLKFHLSLYNLSDREKLNWFNHWLRKIGEEPVVMDPYLVDKSTQQLTSYARGKGFFNASVTKFITYRKKKSAVSYTLQSGNPYRIRKILYSIEDTGLAKLVVRDSVSTTFRRGIIYDVDLLQAERERIERYLKNRGYFRFSKEYIYFEADSTVGNHQLDLYIGIKSPVKYSSQVAVGTESHHTARIGDIYVFMDYDPKRALADPQAYFAELDTLEYDGLYFIGEGTHFQVRPEVIKRANYLRKGDLYRLDNVDQTYNHLSTLRIFRLINIQFRESVRGSSNPDTLDCYIQLATMKKQSYTLEVEGTNSSGFLGVAGNLIYQHKNLFRGAELFDVRIKGATEAYLEDGDRKYTRELGLETAVQFPRFMFPFLNTESFVKKYDPKTRFSLAYNDQSRPGYTRTIARGSFGYQWRGNRFTTHYVNPFEFNNVRVNLESDFAESIRGTFLEYSFRDVLISESSYSFVFNNQNIKKRDDFTFFRFNGSSAGNIFSAYSSVTGRQKVGDAYRVFGNEFAQYVKVDADISFHQVLNESNEFVFRLFTGAGIPFGNSRALPFEKKYFSGGANSLRAWSVRSVGPGSTTEKVAGSYPNQTGDIRLEANIEYRFELIWVLEGALFLDAGNVWEFNRDEQRPGAHFEWNRFYREFALGTGLGLRFDFNFFLIRLDMGLKLYDPTLGISNKWPIAVSDIKQYPGLENYNKIAFQLGIGYPF